jgi:hypothetical protein
LVSNACLERISGQPALDSSGSGWAHRE